MNVRDEAGYSVDEEEIVRRNEEGDTTEDGNVADMRDERVFARGGMYSPGNEQKNCNTIAEMETRQVWNF